MIATPVTALLAIVWKLPAAIALAVVAVLAVGAIPAVLPLLYIAAITPALCASDLLRHRLPNRLVLPAFAVLLVAMLIESLRTMVVPVPAMVAGLAYFGLMLALSVAGGMGMGDVKLAGVLGLSAGMIGVEAALASPLLAFLAGGVAAAIVLIAARGRRGIRIPFGPFMLLGFWAAIVLRF